MKLTEKLRRWVALATRGGPRTTMSSEMWKDLSFALREALTRLQLFDQTYQVTTTSPKFAAALINGIVQIDNKDAHVISGKMNVSVGSAKFYGGSMIGLYALDGAYLGSVEVTEQHPVTIR